MELAKNWTKDSEDLYKLCCTDDKFLTEEQITERNNFYKDATLQILRTFILQEPIIDKLS